MRAFLSQILFIGMIAFAPLYATPQIAVLTFSGDPSLSPAQLQSITEKFQSELLRANVYNILERNQLDAILQEQGLQSSGACEATGCQVELGKLLSVDKIITGSVVLFDDLYALNTKQIDVLSGAVDYSWFTKIQGSLTDVLDEGCPLAARQVIATGLRVPFATDTTIIGSSRLRQQEAARQASAQIHQEKQKQERSNLVKGSLLALSVAVIGTGIVGGAYNNVRSNDAYEEYSALRGTDAQSQTALDDAWQRVRDKESKRNKYYGLAGFGGALFVGTSVFF